MREIAEILVNLDKLDRLDVVRSMRFGGVACQVHERLDARQLCAEVERLRAENAKLKAFARDMLEDFWEDYDKQCCADNHGLIVKVTMAGPCGEGCMCEDANAEFPLECYRLVDWVKEAENG